MRGGWRLRAAVALAGATVLLTGCVVGGGGGAAPKSIGDLKGRRVSVGSPRSGTEVIALRILAAAQEVAPLELHAGAQRFYQEAR